MCKRPLARALGVCALLTLIIILSTSAFAATGERPHDIAVRGTAYVATSLRSDYVSVSQSGNESTQYLGASSWGVCFIGQKAVVTTPSTNFLSILTFNGSSVTIDNSTCSGAQFADCTEIIPSNGSTNVVYVARVGVTASSTLENAWQHSVIKVDISTGNVLETYITERQPRALALSPDDERLFVGTAQGALGGAGLTAANADPWNLGLFDGGSLLVYDESNGVLEYRLAIGSPVRGLAVLDGVDYDSAAGDYRVYFTHVGNGAQSEAPAHGGKAIPNVITSLKFSSAHVADANARQNTIFKHDSTLDDTAVNPSNLPAVIPEKLAIRPLGSGASHAAELWVTHSASGTVSRAYIADSTGAIVTQATPVSPLGSFPVVTSRAADGFTLNTAPANSGNATISFHVIDPALHVRTDPSGANGSGLFGSRPRGIAYDSTSGDMLVVTEFDHELLRLDANGAVRPTRRDLSAGASVIDDERDFFTFGRGFDFRESGPSDMVNNISCGTCHVDGHIDGKVRVTVRPADNATDNVVRTPAVAVPSLFDVGQTEWLFFEGLTTIADRTGAVDSGGGSDICNYCSANDFFLNTIEFTDSVSSPHSPWASGGVPSANAEVGRAWFDAMNCSRCHAESSPGFLRTNDPAVNDNDDDGPIGATANILSDPTQVFITDTGTVSKAPVVGDRNSLRNMTNVGTRDHETNLDINGVNTPGLAGAWDNRPYFHDGRYRTLDEVLKHTWVDSQGLAAPIWTLATAPENSANDPNKAATSTNLPKIGTADFPFKTHKHADPGGGRQTVESYLNTVPGGDYAALLEFLRSLSSELDPYPDATLTLTNLEVNPGPAASTAVVTWDTSVATVCRVIVENTDTSIVLADELTGPGMSHSITVTLNDFANWKATVTTSFGSQRVTDDVIWDNDPEIVFSAISAVTSPFCETTLSWTTSSAVSCVLDWGLYSEPYPVNREVTAAGTSHSVVLSLLPGKKYRALAWTDYQPTHEKVWKIKYCVATLPTVAQSDLPFVMASPNPFNPRTEISFRLPEAGKVDLRIFDIRGRLVRTLMSGPMDAGEHSAIWTGTNDDGSNVASGVYFMRLVGGGLDQTKKLMLVE